MSDARGSELSSAFSGYSDRQMNNLAYWFPLLAATGVPVPRTRIVIAPKDLLRALDGEKVEGSDEFIARLGKAAASLSPNGGPVFLRTGHMSDKHSWKDSCFVDSFDKLKDHVYNLVEFSECADMLGFPTETWVVREFLDLDTRFVAFHGNMPISTEVRCFVGNGRVICRHPYWPEEAFQDRGPSVKSELEAMYATIEAEREIVDELALRVAEFFHGWSVDFARTKDGKWYAIDMALARHSYHWPGCEASSNLAPCPPSTTCPSSTPTTSTHSTT